MEGNRNGVFFKALARSHDTLNAYSIYVNCIAIWTRVCFLLTCMYVLSIGSSAALHIAPTETDRRDRVHTRIIGQLGGMVNAQYREMHVYKLFFPSFSLPLKYT